MEVLHGPAVAVRRPATGAVRVRVPATSANLGPGFDALGLALTLHDDVVVRAREPGVAVHVTGEAEGEVALDERHLVVRAVLAAFDALGVAPPGVSVTCTNRIPHRRGLGSSAAAITAGVVAAGALCDTGISADLALEVACRLEGHPDNVAACLRGGLTLSWYSSGTPAAARLEPLAGLAPVAFVPAATSSTARSRAALPAQVPHADAAANAGRAALLVHALTARPDLLMTATEDCLHQPYRLPTMPATQDLVGRLRAAGVPAVLSGSGPSVLALPTTPDGLDTALRVAAAGFAVLPLGVDRDGARASAVPT